MQDIPPNRLAELRRLRGLSASELAKAVHISRQTIYALEAGDYVPNLHLGLKLARQLEVPIEELFPLPEEPGEATADCETVSMLPSSSKVEPGQGIRLCGINGKLVGSIAAVDSWYLPSADGVITTVLGSGAKAKITLHAGERNFANKILIAGCDPAISVLSGSLQAAGTEMILAHQNSSDALSLLQKGLIHVAGTHLRDDSSGESNLPVIRRKFAGDSAVIVSFANTEEGLVAAAGNPKKIKGIADLTRRNIKFINREPGSGSRTLLDSQLKRLNINSESVRGYAQTADGHFAAARSVKTGAADCCLATRASAQAFGLHFIALQEVRYDFVVLKEHLHLAGIQALLEVMNQSKFRRKLQGTGDYDTSVTGKQIG